MWRFVCREECKGIWLRDERVNMVAEGRRGGEKYAGKE